ncbi:MAG: Cell division protein FtsL [Pseudomonadales bacterium]|nr:Cell division protein FtsL [Pseudomonadales bacterium]
MSAGEQGNAPQRAHGERWPWLALVLLVLAVASSFGVIYAAHTSRELFRQLERERRDENEIQIEWRQLLLERGTLSSHGRVESIARERLRMAPVEGEFRVLVAE